ncbi:MAG: response regulator [Deltaproteobacteria bacterium]|nr:response regulator [Deltaproteobacteria bacterium]
MIGDAAGKKPVPPRILYLEENDDHAQLVRRAMTAEHPEFIVQRVYTPDEAIEALQRLRPALFMTSFYLGGRPILDELPQLRMAAGRTPILVLSRSGDPASAADAIKCGADEYLVKTPDTLQKLVPVITQLLRQRKSRHLHSPAETAPAVVLGHRMLRALDTILHDPNTLGRGPHDPLTLRLGEICQHLETVGASLGKRGPKP